MAAVVASAVCVITAQYVNYDRAFTPRSLGLVAALISIYYSLCERADMYNAQWSAIVPTQFLCSISETNPLPQISNPASLPGTAPEEAREPISHQSPPSSGSHNA
jgi:hypothetical protein